MPASASQERQDVILRLIRQRDEAGMRQLFQYYGGALNFIIAKIIPETEVAEEVLHDVLLKVWNNIEQYETQKSRFFTWMARIARNAAIDKVRSKSYRKSTKTDTIGDFVSKRNELSEDMRTDHIGLDTLMTTLDEQHRSIIELLYFRDFTQKETAEELGLPLGTVKTRARRALQNLRELLKNEKNL